MYNTAILLTSFACVLLTSCNTYIGTYEKRLAGEIKPLTSTPKKLLVGGWVRRDYTKYYRGLYANGTVVSQTKNMPTPTYRGKWTYYSGREYHLYISNLLVNGNGGFVKIKFLNDDLLLWENCPHPYVNGYHYTSVFDRVPLRKVAAVNKSSSGVYRTGRHPAHEINHSGYQKR